MPPRPRHAAVGIRHHELPILAHRAGAIDHQSAGGVIKTQQIEFGAWCGVKYIRQGQL